MSEEKIATFYRMVLPEETCPFGLRARRMLENGFALDEHIPRSREEVDAFEEEQGVDTPRQIFIGASGSAPVTTSSATSRSDGGDDHAR